MKEKKLNISVEDQIEILIPAIEDYAKETMEALQFEREEEDYSITMRMIFDPNKEDIFPKRYVLQENWETFQEFLSGKLSLKCMVEKGEKGLVKRDPVYWVFFDPKMAHSFFSSPTFSRKYIDNDSNKTFPKLELTKFFRKTISELTEESGHVNTIPRITKIIDVITLADWYLEKEKALGLDSFVRQRITPLIHIEIHRLIEVQSKPNAKAAEKRAKMLFKLGWRYYRTRNEMESAYFNKILDKDPEQQLKGLKLMESKVQKIYSKK